MNNRMNIEIRVPWWIYVYLEITKIYHQVIVGGKPNIGVIEDTVIKAISIEYRSEK